MWRPILSLLLFFLNQVLAFIFTLLYELRAGNIRSASLEDLNSVLSNIDAVHYGTALLFTTIAFIGIMLLTRLSWKGALTAFSRGLPRNWAWGIGGFIVISLGVNGILSPFDIENPGVSAIFSGMQHSVWCAMLIIFAGPLAEELVFRDCIIRGMLPAGRWWAVIISSFAFACIHGNLMQGIPAFVMGVILALLYLQTGDLRLCLPAHILNNALGFWELHQHELTECSGQWPPYVLPFVGGCLLICGLWMLKMMPLNIRNPR